MSAKVCPRCGSLYQSLKSATCPQCFAILDTIDDQTAQELSAEKAKEESNKEFQEARKQDNEQWAEQSFKACLGIVGITFVTLVVSVIILATAISHRRHGETAKAMHVNVAVAPVVKTQGLSTAALPNEILPSSVGSFTRTALQSDIMLPGVTDSVIHGTYILPSQGGAGSPVVGPGYDVFVIRETSLETKEDAFRLGCTMAAHVGSPTVRSVSEGATQNWTYAVIGNTEPDGTVKAQELLKDLTALANN